MGAFSDRFANRTGRHILISGGNKISEQINAAQAIALAKIGFFGYPLYDSGQQFVIDELAFGGAYVYSSSVQIP